ncbi:DUF4870 domain-containing protein [Bizionia myxarmorum]|uniref:DUF4870 domain-containing protein n=1 Tax=Bizionia myxarmorum TaxID=291186 RepID=A0A5D0R5M5_9FLAO|nr:DUF4870 domain-containing protein [Bizionia myxarmorum]TYB76349.1 hypothetical protein ES674_12220 [Bizionia myxarmorum]
MMTEETIKEGKTMALVAYFTIVGSIIAIIMNSDRKNPFTSFHAKQGLGLNLTYMIVGYFISSFDSFAISIGFWIAIGVLFMYGIYSAITENCKQVPLLGALYQKLFATIA